MNGAFASHVVVPAWLLHPLPAGIPDGVAVLAEPMAVVMTALRHASLAAGDFVLVVGPGPVGALAALACRAAGASNVVVAGRTTSPARLELLSDMGFTTLSSDVPDAVRGMTSGRGADLVVECSGSAQGIAIGIEAARRTGRMASIGLSGQPALEVPWDLATSRALDVAFSMSSSFEGWEAAIPVLARVAADAARLPTIFPLASWRDAFAALQSRSVVKAVLDPTAPTTASVAES
jgi:L-iditol 2-dehydrogenase